MIFRGEVTCLKFSDGGTEHWAPKKKTPQGPLHSFCSVRWLMLYKEILKDLLCLVSSMLQTT